MSHLSWEGLRMPQEEVGSMAKERDAWNTSLGWFTPQIVLIFTLK